MKCPSDVEQKCPWSAKKYYYERYFKNGHTGWPVQVVVEDPTEENQLKALEEGPYGECVYNGQNDQNDNQVVTMEFNNGASATMTMIAFTEAQCERKTRIMGTLGEIEITDEYGFKYFDFLARKSEYIDLKVYQYSKLILIKKQGEIPKTDMKGHGYADYFMFKAFIESIKNNDNSQLLSDGEEAYLTHKLVFRAEEARLKRTTIHL